MRIKVNLRWQSGLGILSQSALLCLSLTLVACCQDEIANQQQVSGQ